MLRRLAAGGERQGTQIPEDGEGTLVTLSRGEATLRLPS